MSVPRRSDNSARQQYTPYRRSRQRKLDLCVVLPHYWEMTRYDGYHELLIQRERIEIPQYQRMVDVVTPNFLTLVRKGFYVNSPCTKQTTTCLVTTGSVTYVSNERPSGAYSYTGAHLNVSPDYDTFMLQGAVRPTVVTKGDLVLSPQEALIRAYAEVNGQVQQLLVELAELDKTLKLMSGLLTELIYQLQRFRRPPSRRDIKRWFNREKKKSARGGFGAAAKEARQSIGGSTGYATEKWLQWRYGVMPLCYSIQDAQQAIASLVGKRHKVTGRGTDKDQRSWAKTYTSNFAYCNSGAVTTFNDTHQVSLDGVCRAYVHAEASISLSHLTGTDITALPGAAYELIPYSFVVDWVVDIGTWLQAVNLAPGTRVLASGVSTKTHVTETRTYVLNPHSYTTGTGTSLRSCSCSGMTAKTVRQTSTYQRDVNLDVPFHPSWLGFRKALTPVKHTLDAISLAFQGFGKKRR